MRNTTNQSGTKPGETRTFLVLVVLEKLLLKVKKAVNDFKDLTQADRELENVNYTGTREWKEYSDKLPIKSSTSMINTWIMYNCLVTFAWSRSASLIYTALTLMVWDTGTQCRIFSVYFMPFLVRHVNDLNS
jgi:cellobiose phosphorylase